MSPSTLINKKILIIDDDTIFFEIVSYFLTEKSVKSESAVSIEQGISKLKQQKYDFVLIDSFLPDGMGVEILPVIYALDYNVPIMMVTGNDDQEYMKACFEAGISDYILKPANIELVWLKIQRCYNTYVMEQQLQLQNQQLEALLDEKRQEENLARHVYKHLSQPIAEVDEAIHCHMQASSLFNGDFFVSGQAPNGNKILTLVDATGHGLAAAISVLPLVSAIRAMVKKGLSLGHLAFEINNKLYNEIPDDRFVAGIGVEYDASREELHIFNAGMPEAILLDKDCQVIQRIKSESLPLGILDQQSFSPVINKIQVESAQYLLLYSDGLIEQVSANGELFGKQSLESVIKQCASPDSLVTNLVDAFSEHKGYEAVTDDVSICCVNLDTLKEPNQHAQENEENLQSGELNLTLNLSGQVLGKTDMLSLLDETLKRSQIDISLRKKAFTVFAELVNNALDHGVLNLESSLKSDYSGFAEYLEQREQGLKSLSMKDQILVDLHYSAKQKHIVFKISDSGSGYQKSATAALDDKSLSGRGIKLIEELSQELVVHPPGNVSSVVIK